MGQFYLLKEMTTNESSSNFESGINHDSILKAPRTFIRKTGKLLAGLSLLLTTQQPKTVSAEEASRPPLKGGTDFSVDVEPGRIIIGNLTSIGEDSGGGWAAAYTGEYQGTSTTNVKGSQHVSPNIFFAKSDEGQLNVRVGDVGGPAQHEVVDQMLSLPDTGFIDLFPQPVRSFDSRALGMSYKAGDVFRVDYGPERAGQGAIINLTIDLSKGPAWFAAYPCNEGYQGTSSANTDGIGATPTAEIVKVDSAGEVCFVGNQDLVGGLVVDTLGFIDEDAGIHAPVRRTDTRTTGDRLMPLTQRVIETGVPNALYVARLTIDKASGPGWVSAFPTEVGYQGNSIVNPDGKNAVSGLLSVMTDSQGRLSIYGNISADLILDEIATISLAQFDISPDEVGQPKRLFDSRSQSALAGAFSINPLILDGQGAVTADQVQFVCYSREVDVDPTTRAYMQRYILQIVGLNPDTNPSVSESNGDPIFLEVSIDSPRGPDVTSGVITRADAEGKVINMSGHSEYEGDHLSYNITLDIERTLPSGAVAVSKFAILASCSPDTGATKI